MSKGTRTDHEPAGMELLEVSAFCALAPMSSVSDKQISEIFFI
jgi:hypothetical protein